METMVKKHSRRRFYFCYTLLVILLIVFLSVLIPDVIRKYRGLHITFGSPHGNNGIYQRQSLFPIVLKHLTVAARSYFDFTNATLTADNLLNDNTKVFSGYDDDHHGNQDGDHNGKSNVPLPGDSSVLKVKPVLDDPLVFTPKVDANAPLVEFPYSKDGEVWSGRPMYFNKPGYYFIKDEQYAFIQQSIQTGGLNITKLASYSMASKMEDWEWDFYTGNPMSNIRETADEQNSRVTLLNETRTYMVGEKITVRIDLYDGFNKARTVGGDDVRVWIRDESIAAGAGADVIDLKNGSYLATISLLFPGNPQIKVSLTYPRELVRTVLYLRNVMKGLRLNAGGFVSEFASEAVICSPLPFSGPYKELCNLTSLNYGLSWYCGRPQNPSLRCRHWKQIRDLEFPQPLPVSHAEREWFDQLSSGTKHHLRLLTNSVISVKVIPKNTPDLKGSPLCNRRPRRELWTDERPKGYFLHNQWFPLDCTIPPIALSSINECLQGSTVYMIGDSNLRHMMEMMAFYGLCSPTKQLIGKRNWHSPQLCINHHHKYMVRWRTHAFPFHTNADHWAPRTNQQAVGKSLDEIPATGKYFILIHMYLHFTTHHYTIYHERIRAMRDAVARILARNPKVKVVIRGPHAAFKGWNPMLGGDLHGKLYMKILREEFKDLYDKVILLDFWDYTVAAESQDFHPEGHITQQMLKVFFGYICD